LKANPNLVELTIKTIFHWHNRTKCVQDAILAMPNLRTLLLRFSDDDFYPRDLDKLVCACPLIKVYGHRFNDLGELAVPPKLVLGADFKKRFTDFAKKASKWEDLREFKIWMPPVSKKRDTLAEVAIQIFSVFWKCVQRASSRSFGLLLTSAITAV
jgi:hypothetical protein